MTSIIFRLNEAIEREKEKEKQIKATALCIDTLFTVHFIQIINDAPIIDGWIVMFLSQWNKQQQQQRHNRILRFSFPLIEQQSVWHYNLHTINKYRCNGKYAAKKLHCALHAARPINIFTWKWRRKNKTLNEENKRKIVSIEADIKQSPLNTRAFQWAK